MSKVIRKDASPDGVRQTSQRKFDSENPDHIHALNDVAIEQCDSEYQFCADQVASWSKWLTASLLLLNSAALVSLFEKPFFWSAGLYLGGVALALISGVVMQEIYNRQAEISREQWIELQKVKAGFLKDVEAMTALQVRAKSMSKWHWIPPVAGWISGILFVSASIIAIISGALSPPTV